MDLRLSAVTLLFVLAVLALIVSAQISSVSAQLCNIVSNVQFIVGIVAVTLFVIGGVMYAVSHFLPSEIEIKKSVGGWAQAMIVGGAIGLLIVLVAQPLVSLVTGIGLAVNSGAGGTLTGCGGATLGAGTTSSESSSTSACASPNQCVPIDDCVISASGICTNSGDECCSQTI